MKLRTFVIDVTPLRTSRDFRLLWCGQAVSFLGTGITHVAIPLQVYALTKSSFAVGLTALCYLLPLLVVSLFGGVVADARDRRRVFLLTEVTQGAVALALAANAIGADPSVGVIYALAAVRGALSGLGRPSLTAMIPRLVPADQLASAAALNSVYGTVGMVLGPLLAGGLIVATGYPGTYVVDALTFGAVVWCLGRMAAVPPPDVPPRTGLTAVREGLAYLRRDQLVQGTYAIDFVAMVFGFPTALFPALAVTRFHRSESAASMLFAAVAAGAFVASATSGWTKHVHRHGRAITIAAVAWGVAITAFGVVHNFALALVFLAVAGGADMVSGVFRMTVWNTTIPDELRGRLAGLEWANVNSGPALGDVEAGAVAAWRGPGFAVVSGGVLCVIGTIVLAGALPAFLRYDRRSLEGASDVA